MYINLYLYLKSILNYKFFYVFPFVFLIFFWKSIWLTFFLEKLAFWFDSTIQRF